jgi:hypothetical protein
LNQLSLLLYWGNVAQHIGGFCVFICICLFVLGAACVVANFMSLDAMNRYGTDNVQCMKDAKKGRMFSFVCLFFILIFGTISAFMPSQDTVYAIAASELGGRVLNSQTGNLADQALNAWLKRQINPPEAPSNQ